VKCSLPIDQRINTLWQDRVLTPWSPLHATSRLDKDLDIVAASLSIAADKAGTLHRRHNVLQRQHQRRHNIETGPHSTIPSTVRTVAC